MSSFVSDALRVRVRELDKDCCAYCRTPEALTVTIFEIDHIIPLCADGMTVLDNLCLACPTCNRYKGTKQAAFDAVMDQSVPLYHPRHQTWSEHFAWNEEFEIMGLSPTGRATVEVLHMNRPRIVRLRRLWAKLGYRFSSDS
jgi:5-methylcytosine-specific restriction endonuclease McrA